MDGIPILADAILIQKRNSLKNVSSSQCSASFIDPLTSVFNAFRCIILCVDLLFRKQFFFYYNPA